MILFRQGLKYLARIPNLRNLNLDGVSRRDLSLGLERISEAGRLQRVSSSHCTVHSTVIKLRSFGSSMCIWAAVIDSYWLWISGQLCVFIPSVLFSCCWPRRRTSLRNRCWRSCRTVRGSSSSTSPTIRTSSTGCSPIHWWESWDYLDFTIFERRELCCGVKFEGYNVVKAYYNRAVSFHHLRSSPLIHDMISNLQVNFWCKSGRAPLYVLTDDHLPWNTVSRPVPDALGRQPINVVHLWAASVPQSVLWTLTFDPWPWKSGSTVVSCRKGVCTVD